MKDETARNVAENLLLVSRKLGLVTPKLECENCGTRLGFKLVAHHHDYFLPLDVKWLCRSCHSRNHAKNGAALNRDVVVDVEGVPAFVEALSAIHVAKQHRAKLLKPRSFAYRHATYSGILQ